MTLVLVIKYELTDGEYYYHRAPAYDTTGEQLKKLEQSVRDRAAELDNPVVQVQYIEVSEEDYAQIPSTNRSAALFTEAANG